MKVLITGAKGFIGLNLKSHLVKRKNIEIVTFNRENENSDLFTLVNQADFIFHLAGVNRSLDDQDFIKGNVDLTHRLCEAVIAAGKKIPILYTSSTQAERASVYGTTKKSAEEILLEFSQKTQTPVHIYRLPNVFGKWSKPNYNSAVATFCYNIARNLPITINDPQAEVNLAYIDDVVENFINLMDGKLKDNSKYKTISSVYKTTVGALAAQIELFHNSRDTLITEAVGCGFIRALYATYVSFLPPHQFSYEVVKHSDPRGVFVEVLKTKDSGQFSFFTAFPGITRGGHYHHTKSEKFIVIKGKARFRFRHIITADFYEIYTCGDMPEIVETVPGWTHDITNIGNDEMIVMLWANEIFDRTKPDTFAQEI